ncbi:MAG: hypothetical protein J6Z50_06280 [Fibrobacterales bacterium]|nr:hypothetical protein [Fibrobacterales bacterium]
MTARNSLLSLAAALALGCLVSCGDSTGGSGGSNGSGSVSGVKSSIKVVGDTIRYTEERTVKIYSVDEEARVMLARSPQENYCVREDGVLSWETVKELPDTMTLSYSFGTIPGELVGFLEQNGYDVEGRVVLYLFEDEYYANIFLGRDSSTIFGEWQETPCYVDLDYYNGDGVGCDDTVVEGTLKIGNGSVTEKSTTSVSKNYWMYDKPFRSAFMGSLYERLATGRAWPQLYPHEMFTEDSVEVLKVMGDYMIAVKEQTAKSQTFEIDGKSYTARILKSSADYRGYAGGLDYSVDMEVADESETCRITVRSISKVDGEYCADKYMDNYEWDSEWDYDDNEFEYADAILWSNAEEHGACLKRIAARGSDAAPAVAKAARRTAANKIQIRPAKKRLFAR